jgi:hypothetical protein
MARAVPRVPAPTRTPSALLGSLSLRPPPVLSVIPVGGARSRWGLLGSGRLGECADVRGKWVVLAGRPGTGALHNTSQCPAGITVMAYNVPQWGGTNLVIFARALFGTLTVRVGNVTAVAGQLTVLTS